MELFRGVTGKTLFIGLCMVFSACVKDRVFEKQVVTSSSGITNGTLLINEFVATGSVDTNEFGTASDWFKIYNPDTATRSMESGQWFVSDDITVQQKYMLPALSIPPHGFQVIWCDGLDTVATEVHTNFNLSSAGEDIVLHYNDGTYSFNVDEYTFPAQTAGHSTGRLPDGGTTWNTSLAPTPGASNHP